MKTTTDLVRRDNKPDEILQREPPNKYRLRYLEEQVLLLPLRVRVLSEHVAGGILKAGHCGEDQHEDRGQEEERVEAHQDLGRNLDKNSFSDLVTIAGFEESASSKRSHILRLMFEQQIPWKVSDWKYQEL